MSKSSRNVKTFNLMKFSDGVIEEEPIDFDSIKTKKNPRKQKKNKDKRKKDGGKKRKGKKGKKSKY